MPLRASGARSSRRDEVLPQVPVRRVHSKVRVLDPYAELLLWTLKTYHAIAELSRSADPLHGEAREQWADDAEKSLLNLKIRFDGINNHTPGIN